MSKSSKRPDRRDYYLGLAIAAAARAECVGLRVGAVLVRDCRVLSTGYNGTPEGMGNCSETGTCPRCDSRKSYGRGNGYDRCICVHAEMNAIAAAARFGVALDGASAYVTHQPCFTCAKELIQVGIRDVFYMVPLRTEAPGPKASKKERKRTIELIRTEERLIGVLRAVRVEPTGAITSLRCAVDKFAEVATS